MRFSSYTNINYQDLISTKKYTLAGIFLLLAGTFFFSACSTKKNTWTRRTYHNTTAHYNVYWNGMDLMRQGIKDYDAQMKDNFSLVIPVYNFGDKSGNKAALFADNAIKKASKTIQKHSMFFNHKEYCKWIDDAYMLIGISYFYKRDYPMARRTFEFVIKTYNDNDIKYNAMFWLAMANVQMGDYNRGEPMLDMLLNKITKGEAPPKYEEKANLAYANSYILQRNYDAAIPYLNRALELNPKVKIKTRIYFILGQIYQKQDDPDRAAAMYTQVLKHNSAYEMEFNAKINLAQCYTNKSTDREYIVKKLKKMLKDEKNKEYLDQIYYALAQISLTDKDTIHAIDYLGKSVSTSKTNNYQRAISALQLADIYFSFPNYPKAQAYYDSTMQFLPVDFANYKAIKKKTATLTDLVQQLQLIGREDSLQSLAAMSEDQRNKIIDRLIANYLASEVKKNQEEQVKLQNQMFANQEEKMNTSSTQGRWYFYNAATLANGFSAFGKKWGRRRLEDNWFLTDKAITTTTTETPADTLPDLAAAGGDTTSKKKPEKKSTNPKDRKYYNQDIPLTPAKLLASNQKIMDAYYKAGFIYIEGLNDYGHSIESFETLLKKYPDFPRKAQTYFELYSLYKDLKNDQKSDYYRTLLLTGYPESDYAKLLINPDYFKELATKKSESSKLYEITYKAFLNQQYYMVISNAAEAHSHYKSDTSLLPRFDYLRALSLGKIEVADSMTVALLKIQQDYPRSPVSSLCQEVINSLASPSGPGVQAGKTPADSNSVLLKAAESIYKFDSTAVHFYILIVNNLKVDVNALKIKIADFNSRMHGLDELEVNSLLFDNNQEMITVSNFDNAPKAMQYFLSIRDSKYIFTKLETSGDYSDFLISVTNYPVLYRNKDIRKYIKFFEKNYLEKP
ncbi:MAG: tetratricopeptide repeat protein [Bacteroidetes bacterium]|nr:tetratricopeptide repeat protein [Bacteroidota bacterium]